MAAEGIIAAEGEQLTVDLESPKQSFTNFRLEGFLAGGLVNHKPYLLL